MATGSRPGTAIWTERSFESSVVVTVRGIPVDEMTGPVTTRWFVLEVKAVVKVLVPFTVMASVCVARACGGLLCTVATRVLATE